LKPVVIITIAIVLIILFIIVVDLIFGFENLIAYTQPQIKEYEINTLSEFCEIIPLIYQSGYFRDYDNARQEYLRSMEENHIPWPIGGPAAIKEMEEKFINNVMSNYDINPELHTMWNKHVKQIEYLDCQTTP